MLVSLWIQSYRTSDGMMGPDNVAPTEQCLQSFSEKLLGSLRVPLVCLVTWCSRQNRKPETNLEPLQRHWRLAAL